MRLSSYMIPLIGFMFIGCQVLKEPAAVVMSTTLPNPEIEKDTILPAADFNLSVKDVEGKLVYMEDYKGKVIFLNFWATWCMPCVAELPSINKLYNELRNEEIVFLLISNEHPNKVKNYRDKKGYDVPFLVSDNESIIPGIYYSPSIPVTFLISKDGKIIRSSTGAEDWDDNKFIEDIKEIL